MKFKWDGKSRPVDDKYRKRWDEIFGEDKEKFNRLQQEQRDLDEDRRARVRTPVTRGPRMPSSA